MMTNAKQPIANDWPFNCTREQMDAMTAVSVEIEDMMGKVEEVCEAAGIQMGGFDFWTDYVEAMYRMQSTLRFWGDYASYIGGDEGQQQDDTDMNRIAREWQEYDRDPAGS